MGGKVDTMIDVGHAAQDGGWATKPGGMSGWDDLIGNRGGSSGGSAAAPQATQPANMSFSEMIADGRFWDINPFAKFGTLYGEPDEREDMKQQGRDARRTALLGALGGQFNGR